MSEVGRKSIDDWQKITVVKKKLLFWRLAENARKSKVNGKRNGDDEVTVLKRESKKVWLLLLGKSPWLKENEVWADSE